MAKKKQELAAQNKKQIDEIRFPNCCSTGTTIKLVAFHSAFTFEIR